MGGLLSMRKELEESRIPGYMGLLASAPGDAGKIFMVVFSSKSRDLESANPQPFCMLILS
jgi:hypothetical protein